MTNWNGNIMDIDELKRRAGIEEAEDVPMDIEELQRMLVKIKQRIDSGDVATASSQINQLIRSLRHASKTPIYSDKSDS